MSLGKNLRHARESKNISIDDVYIHTRIHPDIINALEKDDYARINNVTYTKSFLKEYASYLNLDVKKIIDEFESLSPLHKKKNYKQQGFKEKLSQKYLQELLKNQKLLKIVTWVVVSFVFVIIIKSGVSFIGSKISSLKQHKQTESIRVDNSQADKNTAEVNAGTFVDIAKNEKLNLKIKAKDDVWIRVKVDGRIIFENILKKGNIENWQAEDSFAIWTGKAHELELTLNNNYIGTAGNGVVKNLIINRKGIK